MSYYDTGYFDATNETESRRPQASDLFLSFTTNNPNFNNEGNSIPIIRIDNSSSTEEINTNDVDERDGMLKLKEEFIKLLPKNESSSRHLTINYQPTKHDKRVTINVSGIRYETCTNTLQLLPESRLANLNESCSNYDPIKKEYFFDRHPGAFIAILNFYRTGKLHVPAGLCVNSFSEELLFWGISDSYFAPCCWSIYSTHREVDSTLKKILKKQDFKEGTISSF